MVKNDFLLLILFSYLSISSQVYALNINDMHAEQCSNCGRLMLGAAKIQPNVFQWVGMSSVSSVSMKEAIPSFGFTGSSNYTGEPIIKNKWGYGGSGSVGISSVTPNGTAPSMGYFFAPDRSGITNSTLEYTISDPPLTPVTGSPNVVGEGVEDGNGDTVPALTLDIQAEGIIDIQACQNIIQCEEGQLSKQVTFTITPLVNPSLLPANVEPVTHMYVELFTNEVNTFCSAGNTALNTRGITANNFTLDNYFHYLESRGPNVSPKNCRYVFGFLSSINKPFKFQVLQNRSTEQGYADYTFFVRGHYDINDPSKWQGSHKTYRLRTTDQIQPTTNQSPTARFTATPENSASLVVNLNASGSSDPDGTISTYTWSTSAGLSIPPTASTQIRFPSAGTYTVNLTVTDNNGATSTTQQTVTVSSTPVVTTKPAAIFTMTPLSGEAPLQVQFNAGSSTPSSNARQITTYKWTSSDNTPITASSQPTATFRQVGTHTITLAVTDELGNTGTSSQTLLVKQGTIEPVDAPVANFTYTWLTPTRIKVDASSSAVPSGRVIESYRWNTSDGQNLAETVPTTEIEFPEVGTYTVTLTIEDDQGEIDAKAKKIEVVSRTAPIAAFSITPDNGEGFSVLNVKVNATSVSYDPDNAGTTDPIGITHYAWSWSGNGESGTMPQGVTSEIDFDKPGLYTIELKVIDDDGISSVSSTTITVKDRVLPTLGKGVLLTSTGENIIMEDSTILGGVQRITTGEFVETSGNITVNEEVDINATINVSEQHIGQTVDIVTVLEYTKADNTVELLMKTVDNSFYKPFEQWDFDVAKLKALIPSATLSSSMAIPVYKGKFHNGIGKYRVFIGYRLTSGSVLYNGDGDIRFNVVQ